MATDDDADDDDDDDDDGDHDDDDEDADVDVDVDVDSDELAAILSHYLYRHTAICTVTRRQKDFKSVPQTRPGIS